MDAATPPMPDADLARRLRETEAELARVRHRLDRLESSTTVQLARAVAAAVRTPRTGLPQLPRAVAVLLRRRRGRGPAPSSPGPPRGGKPGTRGPGAGGGPGPTGGGGAAGASGERLPDRLLAASAVLVATRDRPVLAVVADAARASAWSDGAHVQWLRPDDAVAVFAAVTPDVLVVDAAAGRDGPWSGLGTYVVPERDRAVLDLLRAARDRRIPAVLVPAATPEEAPMLADARQLFSGQVSPGAGVDAVLAAAQEPA